MPIDPVTSLAFSLQSQPGVYAVLIGSGVSRAANIPTGWGIVNELLRRLAVSEGEDIAGEPVDWFQSKYGSPAGFSTLIGQLAPSRSDRRALLASFIEPSSPDSEDRRPTPAHRALARLARNGVVRVFITTNFDRLLEQAFTDEGVIFSVISNPAQASGTQPLHHLGVVVFKLHGDYLDPDSMLVTEDELARYDPKVEELLARTLEDYGLVVSGWSAEWDPALVAAVQATRARRYPLWITSLTTASPVATAMVAARSGTIIPIQDADSFFVTLADRIDAIARFSEPHPLDTVAMVTSLKVAIPRPEKRIELEEMVSGVAERLHDEYSDPAMFPIHSAQVSDTPDGLRWLADQADRYWYAVEPFAQLLTVGINWGGWELDELWARSLSRIANSGPSIQGTSLTALTSMQLLPAVVATYAAGLAALHDHRYDALRAISVGVTYRDRARAEGLPLVAVIRPNVFNPDVTARVLLQEIQAGHKLTSEELTAIHQGGNRNYTPVSDLLHDRLRSTLKPIVADADEYTACFDRLEAWFSVIVQDLVLTRDESAPWINGPWFGAFLWRDRRRPVSTLSSLLNELQNQSTDWPPLQAGLFDHSEERALAAFDAVLPRASSIASGMM